MHKYNICYIYGFFGFFENLWYNNGSSGVILAKDYNSKDIVVLEGLDAVRLRPGMYIGTTGSKGMHHLLWEIVDNAMDEVANKYGDTITVIMYEDNSVSVEDNGRGIPVDKHPTMKVSGVQVVFTQLHAGGKFNNKNYAYSGGLHGVGASVTNALSRYLNVHVYTGGQEYYMEFASIQKSNGKISSGVPVKPLECIGKTKKKGTLVTFLPDDRVFGTERFDYSIISKRLRELAFLNKGVKIILIDHNQVQEDGTSKKVIFHYENGLIDFINYIHEGAEVINKNPIYIEGKGDVCEVAMALQYNNSYIDNVYSFVNNIPTTEGGTHETGMRSAITRAFNEIARNFGLLKDKDSNLMGDDFREGMTAILAIKMKNVQFEGQTKAKLGNPEAKAEVENIVYQAIIDYSMAKSSKSSLTDIINKAKGAAKAREAAKHAKEAARKINSLDSFSLVGKLSSCTGKNPLLNEVFIVEGDSAGGSAKLARDKSFQSILPLKGKPLNVEKKRINQILENEEIRTIITAVGAGIGKDFNVDNIKYNKVIILSDADQDGAHIRAILVTFFYRYMRDLIADGHLYIGVAPLYKVYKKGITRYVYDDKDYDRVVEEVGPGYQVQRYKGLGEMNGDQLWETTMDPDKRLLVRVSLDDAAEAERMITTLMGDNIEARKQYIIENADFNKKDIFEQKNGNGGKR